MIERAELKHATLEPEQTLRFRALELAILSERELRYITLGADDKHPTWEVVTERILERADAFDAYITNATVPEKSS